MINNEITNFFEIKHQKLIKKENKLKETLNNEVTKKREKLENFVSELNINIKNCERLNKIKEVFEKEEQEQKKNILEILSYISYFSKRKKEMRKILIKPILNLKFSFKDNEQVIIFEENEFHGLQPPKDIKCEDIDIDKLNISWKFNYDNLIELNEKNIKFKVEIKRKDINEKFIQVYEGNNQNCLVDDLQIGTTYEVRILSIYNDSIMSPYSPIQKVKTLNVDSNILRESKRQKEFSEILYKWSGYKSMELIYRGTRDGATSEKFHEKCDNQGPTICLYKNEKGYIFGGYVSISWKTEGNNYYKAPHCFIFTLTNIHGTQPTLFEFKDSNYSVFHGRDHGAHFGGDIQIFDDFLKTESKSDFPDDYKDILGKGKSILTGNLNNDNKNFKIKEIEVFKLFK